MTRASPCPAPAHSIAWNSRIEDADAKSRYKKIVADPEGMDRLLVDCFLEAYSEPPPVIWLNLDATDDPLHSGQEGRFFHGYYGHYCYLPLYIFSGEHLLCPPTSMTRPAPSPSWSGAIPASAVKHQVDFILGLAKNSRLLKMSLLARREARHCFLHTGEPSRIFCEFRYQTRDSWSRARRKVTTRASWSPHSLPSTPTSSLFVMIPPRWTSCMFIAITVARMKDRRLTYKELINVTQT